jgi:ABC-type multidrug transport system fused ATPase/permease subunit
MNFGTDCTKNSESLMKNKIQNFLKYSSISRALRILERADRVKLSALILIQIALAFLDLLGVAVIGVIGSLTVTGIRSAQPGNRVSEVLTFLHLENQSFQSQIAILGAISAGLLISRTIFSVYFTRKSIFFLSRRGAKISTELVLRLLRLPLQRIQRRSTQETAFAVTTGVQTITLGILATFVTVISDSALLLVLTIGLFSIDPVTSLSTILIFSILTFAVYRLTSARAVWLGNQISTLGIESSKQIIEVLSSYRESIVRNRRVYYADRIGKIRYTLADADAEIQFMPNISKYLVESAVILGAIFIALIQFLLHDSSHAIAVLTLFMAAGSRIAPAVMRLQQNAMTIKRNIGGAQVTLDLMTELMQEPTRLETAVVLDTQHLGFIPKLEIMNLDFTYDGAQKKTLSNINLEVGSGSSLAIVGPSGAGKTTLIDVILGVLAIDSGSVRISGKEPIDTIQTWSGAIGYVPQDVMISDGTIRSNVALGFSLEEATDELVWDALSKAQLKDFVAGLPQGLETAVGERGARISGGQRQRLGIARAMFTRPRLLVLDEATSSLDGTLESEISDSIQELSGDVTVVMIAHRLSTVRNADQVVYLERGEILAKGSFTDVRNQVPNFDSQAKLLGL